MTTLKQRLEDLMKEKKARAVDQNVGLTNQAPISKKNPGKSWKEKRERWAKRYKEHPGIDAPAGELANMIDGLTPDGYDKQGRKVSFVERGEDLTSRSDFAKIKHF